MTTADLPAVNASLNGLSAILLTAGFVCIKRGAVEAHKKCMWSAVGSSTLFLICYLTYHATSGSTKFQGEGAIRTVYFTILISHTILATAIVPMVLITLRHAVKERLEKHKRLAWWTLPLWWYVSVTGVVIYWMLYQMDFA